MAIQWSSIYSLLATLLLLHSANAGTSVPDMKMDDVRTEKKDIIKTLGLRYPERRTPSRKSFLVKKYSAPKFMLSLFNELQNEADGGGLAGDSFLTANMNEMKYLDEAKVDTVISFFKYDHVDAWRHSLRDVKLKFKVQFSAEGEEVKGGEFKLYKRLPRNKSTAATLCTISVYTIQPEGIQRVLLDTREIDAWTSGWLTFNVTRAVKQWALFPLTNYGFQLVVRTGTGSEVNPHDFGIVGMRGNREKRPYLLGFVYSAKSIPTFTQEIISSGQERRTRRATNSWGRKTPSACHLQTFYINFRKIGLHKTIIAPKGYFGHFCEGLCTHPFKRNANASMHALIQSIVHLVDPINIPNPCCAPKELKPISILFYDDNDNIVLKKHAEMVATACACQ